MTTETSGVGTISPSVAVGALGPDAGQNRRMQTLAVIPARGGSKGIPRKNLIDVGGKPLIVWTIQQALAVPGLRVAVSTEDTEIAAVRREGWGLGDRAPCVLGSGRDAHRTRGGACDRRLLGHVCPPPIR
jgi:hypothetical protein